MPPRSTGWWEDAGKHWQHLADIGRRIDADGREQAGRRVIDGVVRIPLRRFEDERGWFCELRRDSALPKPMRQTNVSFSRAGVIRGLHYHERGQDDLFACLRGTARVVVLDRATARHVHRGHRRGQPGRGLHPRAPRARLRGAHGHPLLLPRHGRVRPGRSRRAHGPLERSARRIPMELEHPDPVRAGRRRRVLITGAGGQLGRALAAGVRGRRRRSRSTRADWDVTEPRQRQPVARRVRPRAAHGRVDGRRRGRGRPAGRGRREHRRDGTRRRARVRRS